MKNSKNQTRMEKLATITSMIRKVHEDVRNHDLTHAELVGLNVEVNDLLMAAEALHHACLYQPKAIQVGDPNGQVW
jgi:hypothetical protein